MKVIINVQTGRGKRSTTKDVDKTVDLLQKVMERTERLFRGYKWKDCICSCDGTSIVLEKK